MRTYTNLIRITMLYIVFTVFALFTISILQPSVKAQTNYQLYKGVITDIQPINCTEEDNTINSSSCEKITIELKNKTISLVEDLSQDMYISKLNLKKGDRIILQTSGDQLFIVGVDHSKVIFTMIIIFFVFVILISGKQGISALLGLTITMALLFMIFVPNVLAGQDPLAIGFILSIILLIISVYFSHGFSIKTHSAFIASFILLIIAWLVSIISIKITRLTGLTSEEYVTLLSSLNFNLDVSKLLVTIIIWGTLGSIDDVTVNQAGIVFSLVKNNPDLKPLTLYKEAMKIGRDHIASMINTLIIVYISNSLPIVLILGASGVNMLDILNRELFVQEIVKSIVVSSILILAVPLTTLISIWLAKNKYKLTTSI